MMSLLTTRLMLVALLLLSACGSTTTAYRATSRNVQPAPTRPNPRISYEATYEGDTLHVKMTVATGGLVERTPLQLPAARITDVSFEGEGGFVTEVDEKEQVWVEHGPAFSLTYRVMLDQQPSFDRRRTTSALWDVSDEGLMTTGGFLWVVPLYPGEVDVHISWKGIPERFSTRVHSLPGEDLQQFGALRVYELVQLIHVLGTFEQHESGRVVLLPPVVLEISPQAILSVTNQMLDAAEAYFGGPAPDRFIVLVLPETARRSGDNVSGNALTNGAIVWRQAKWPLLRQFLAHEIVHHWNPWHELDDVDWFAEGITDFIASLLLFDAGLISISEFAEEANSWHRTYYARILDPDFTVGEGDPRYEVGFMLGAQWFSHPEFRPTIAAAYRDRIAGAELHARMHALFGVSQATIAAHVDGSSPLKPALHAFGPCVQLVATQQGEQDLGFDADKTAKRERFVGVTRDGPAYKAGVREGMGFRTLRFSTGGTFANSEVQIELGNGGQIRYFPSRRPYLVPMYVPNEQARASAPACHPKRPLAP